MHLAAQEDKVPVAEVLVKYGSLIDPQTKVRHFNAHVMVLNLNLVVRHSVEVTHSWIFIPENNDGNLSAYFDFFIIWHVL